MRRRNFFKTLAVTPAAAVLEQQLPAQQAAPSAAAPATSLEMTHAEQVADPLPRFFTPEQFSTLRKVSTLIMPSINGAPGALEAKVPEFLDYLIGDSPAERQRLYRAGLDGLNSEAKKKFNKNFEQLDAAQADTLMAPLRSPWTYQAPAEPVPAFLRAAKADVRTATLNSREVLNPTGTGGRRLAGTGLYWNEI